MKKTIKLFRPRRISLGLITSTFIFLMLVMPAISFGQPGIEYVEPKASDGPTGWHGLVPCGRETTGTVSVKTGPGGGPIPGGEDENTIGGGKLVKNECGFYDIIKLVNNITRFILFYLAIPIAAIMFAYAGFLLVTAGGEAAGARTKAKGIFFNALIGLALAAGAWLIVNTILSILGYKDQNLFF